MSDATTEAFVECLKQFISRKGSPSHIYSDNGGNFRGLKELYKGLEETPTQTAITTYLLSERITWHASPDRAPHFGGLWEAAVKSFKTHIKRVVGCQKLNFEELTTVAAQVETCLNSRPLVAATTHSLDGVEFLTLGHFIIGRPIKAYPTAKTHRTVFEQAVEPLPVDHYPLLETMVIGISAAVAAPPEVANTLTQLQGWRHCLDQRRHYIHGSLACSPSS